MIYFRKRTYWGPFPILDTGLFSKSKGDGGGTIVATSLVDKYWPPAMPSVGNDCREKGRGIEMMSKENRSYVRGDILFKVKFTLLSREDYENFERSEEGHFSLNKSSQEQAFPDADDPGVSIPDGNLINFLIHMDEKLDQILSLLSKDEGKKRPFEEGIGLNISGSGMNMIVDKPVEPGRVIHAKFFLTKSRFLFIEVFGEVVRVIPSEEKGERNYQLGIEFLDLNKSDRERIITVVFQKQRQTIRKKKDMGPVT